MSEVLQLYQGQVIAAESHKSHIKINIISALVSALRQKNPSINIIINNTKRQQEMEVN